MCQEAGVCPRYLQALSVRTDRGVDLRRSDNMRILRSSPAVYVATFIQGAAIVKGARYLNESLLMTSGEVASPLAVSVAADSTVCHDTTNKVFPRRYLGKQPTHVH